MDDDIVWVDKYIDLREEIQKKLGYRDMRTGNIKFVLTKKEEEIMR